MNSTLADSSSMISTSTRMVRNNTEKIQPRSDFYLWFFGQIHSKRLIVLLMFLLTLLSLFMLTWPFDAHFMGVKIPGLDDEPYFETPGVTLHPHHDDASSTFVKVNADEFHPRPKVPLTVESDDALFTRNVITITAYYYLFSVFLAALSIRWAEKMWGCGPSPCCCLNPALLLIPFFVSLLSFAFPLLCWTLRSYNSFIHHSCFDKNPQPQDCSSVAFFIERLRFAVLPPLFIWLFYAYVLFGCILGAIYVWRRSSADWKAKESAASSFSWSFRDKNTLLGKTGNYGLLDANKNFGSRLMIGRGSARSMRGGGTDRPSLRGFINRFNENLNDTRGSGISIDGEQDPLNRTIVSEANIDLESADDGELNYSHRPLEVVVEESESQQGSQESLSRA